MKTQQNTQAVNASFFLILFCTLFTVQSISDFFLIFTKLKKTESVSKNKLLIFNM